MSRSKYDGGSECDSLDSLILEMSILLEGFDSMADSEIIKGMI